MTARDASLLFSVKPLYQTIIINKTMLATHIKVRLTLNYSQMLICQCSTLTCTKWQTNQVKKDKSMGLNVNDLKNNFKCCNTNRPIISEI